MILFSVSSYSQTDSTKLTAKYVYQDIKAGFERLVTTLEGPAKHTYAIYVRQYVVNGWMSIIIETTIVIIISFIWILAFRKGEWAHGDIQNAWAVMQVLFGFAFVVALGFLGADFSGNMQRIINPEYYAIQDIINTIK